MPRKPTLTTPSVPAKKYGGGQIHSAGKKPGTVNKSTLMLREQLQNVFGFDTVAELLEHYQNNKLICKRSVDKLKLGVAIDTDEMDVYKHCSGLVERTLSTLISFTYPKFRAQEGNAGLAPSVVLNISIPEPVQQPCVISSDGAIDASFSVLDNVRVGE